MRHTSLKPPRGTWEQSDGDMSGSMGVGVALGAVAVHGRSDAGDLEGAQPVEVATSTAISTMMSLLI